MRYDFVIVGGGSAGSALANRLSAKTGNRVLLIEAGGSDRYIWVHVPVGYLYCIGNPRTDWLYRTAPEKGLGGRSIAYPRGKLLGGCSSVNGMIYMRGQAADYDDARSHYRDPGVERTGCQGPVTLFRVKTVLRHVDEVVDDVHCAGDQAEKNEGCQGGQKWLGPK